LFAPRFSAINSLQECSSLFEEPRAALLSQDRRREGAFTFSLLPFEIAFILSIINDNLVTLKDYFSMSKSSVLPEGTEGLLIRVQPNTYIEKTEHFRTASHLVKQRGWLNKGYNTQEVWEIQPSFAGVYCVFSGLHDNLIGRFPQTGQLLRTGEV
jgi:hypothetical protein